MTENVEDLAHRLHKETDDFRTVTGHRCTITVTVPPSLFRKMVGDWMDLTCPGGGGTGGW